MGKMRFGRLGPFPQGQLITNRAELCLSLTFPYSITLNNGSQLDSSFASQGMFGNAWKCFWFQMSVVLSLSNPSET